MVQAKPKKERLVRILRREVVCETRDKVNDVLWESFPEVYRRSIRRHFLGFPLMPRTPAWKRFVITHELGPRIRALLGERE